MFEKIADFLVYNVLGLDHASQFVGALHFLIYDSIKIISLLYIIVTIISFLRSSINYGKFNEYVRQKPKIISYLLTALLGAVTPFCSCSSIPLFFGFLESGLPFGLAMTFIITSPMINIVSTLVLASVIGTKITTLYTLTGITIGMIGGFLMEKCGLQTYVNIFAKKPCVCSAEKSCSCGTVFSNKISDAISYANSLVSKICPFVLIGVAIGAFIHGYVPEAFFAQYLGANNVFAVPTAVLIGIPLYSDATSIIPIAQELLSKGSGTGTTLAFMMATVALSLPGLLILSRVMQKKLMFAFISFLFIAFVTTGYLYNFL